MAYYKYLKFVLSSLLISYVIFFLLTIYQIGAPTKSSQELHEVITLKTSIANSVQAPKLLIVSGSNSFFGISSQMIAKKTAIPTVNAGLHAGLGIDYILYKARTLARPGDTVLIPLEYELYMPNTRTSSVLLDYVFAHDTKYLSTHPWFVALLSLKRLLLGIYSKVFISQQFLAVDQPKVFANGSGDETNNKKANMTEAQYEKLNSASPVKITDRLLHDRSSLEVIAEFARWCKQNKIKVIATWPNTMWFKAYEKPAYVQIFQAISKFYQDINVPIIGRYIDSMYDKSMFYDTYYHLNDEGVNIRTQQLITLLRPYLGQVMDDQSPYQNS
ncbi:MAG: hypothetical protein JOZ78_16420 [Chroococcidiopsidaceae cyanobacterium CP_BM_ER_R8_30]|nr:hypothetical protein [Chroococcidiopsidaceae cyanobacterium CP_BM_ER_R8_30]